MKKHHFHAVTTLCVLLICPRASHAMITRQCISTQCSKKSLSVVVPRTASTAHNRFFSAHSSPAKVFQLPPAHALKIALESNYGNVEAQITLSERLDRRNVTEKQLEDIVEQSVQEYVMQNSAGPVDPKTLAFFKHLNRPLEHGITKAILHAIKPA